MHKNSSGKDGENRISRLQFLRLLGAGAIGYFAYRAGLIDILFKNATAETGGWLGIITPPQTGIVHRVSQL